MSVVCKMCNNTDPDGSSPDNNVLVVGHGNEREVLDHLSNHQVGQGVRHQHKDLPHMAQETHLQTGLDILPRTICLLTP